MQTIRKLILYLIIISLTYAMAFSIDALATHWTKEPTVIFFGGLIMYYVYLLFLRFSEGSSDEK